MCWLKWNSSGLAKLTPYKWFRVDRDPNTIMRSLMIIKSSHGWTNSPMTPHNRMENQLSKNNLVSCKGKESEKGMGGTYWKKGGCVSAIILLCWRRLTFFRRVVTSNIESELTLSNETGEISNETAEYSTTKTHTKVWINGCFGIKPVLKKLTWSGYRIANVPSVSLWSRVIFFRQRSGCSRWMCARRFK